MPAVRAERVQRGGDVLASRFTGSLEAAARVDLAFRVGGYVEHIAEQGPGKGDGAALDVGDRVKKGQVLARVRSADYAQRVATAKAQLSQARAQETLAEQELQRSTKLFDAKATSRAELDSRTAQRDAARATTQGAAAQLAEASVSLRDTVLEAPMDGVVLARNVEEGSLVSPGVVAFTIADVDTVKVVFSVPQETVARLAVGGPLDVVLDDGAHGDDAALPATIDRIAPAADARGRLFAVESSLANRDGSLRPGSVVSIRVPEGDAATPTLVVPLGAVVRSSTADDRFAVFVVEGNGPRGSARKRDVQLGAFVGNGVTVTDGLAADERVVTAGASLLTDGGFAVVIP